MHMKSSITIVDDGKNVRVESEIDSDRDEVTIRFDTNYTLRLDTKSLIALENFLYSTKRDLSRAKASDERHKERKELKWRDGEI